MIIKCPKCKNTFEAAGEVARVVKHTTKYVQCTCGEYVAQGRIEQTVPNKRS